MTTTYTMDDFINNKLAVRVNKDNILDFLKMCEEKGLVWDSGNKATDFVPSEAECIGFGYDSINTLTYASCAGEYLYTSAGYTFVDFSQIINPTKYQIIIDSDGDTTTAKMVVNGEKIATATAKHNPVDKTDWEFWAKGVFDRLWTKQPAKP